MFPRGVRDGPPQGRSEPVRAVKGIHRNVACLQLTGPCAFVIEAANRHRYFGLQAFGNLDDQPLRPSRVQAEDYLQYSPLTVDGAHSRASAARPVRAEDLSLPASSRQSQRKIPEPSVGSFRGPGGTAAGASGIGTGVATGSAG